VCETGHCHLVSNLGTYGTVASLICCHGMVVNGAQRQDTVVRCYTGWFKYDRDKLWLVYTQIVPVICEPPCTLAVMLFPCFWDRETSILCNYLIMPGERLFSNCVRYLLRRTYDRPFLLKPFYVIGILPPPCHFIYQDLLSHSDDGDSTFLRNVGTDDNKV
jgi:hypothetical protein